eukprot:2194340-Pyramimonas_sp.AAC.1
MAPFADRRVAVCGDGGGRDRDAVHGAAAPPCLGGGRGESGDSGVLAGGAVPGRARAHLHSRHHRHRRLLRLQGVQYPPARHMYPRFLRPIGPP